MATDLSTLIYVLESLTGAGILLLNPWLVEPNSNDGRVKGGSRVVLLAWGAILVWYDLSNWVGVNHDPFVLVVLLILAESNLYDLVATVFLLSLGVVILFAAGGAALYFVASTELTGTVNLTVAEIVAFVLVFVAIGVVVYMRDAIGDFISRRRIGIANFFASGSVVGGFAPLFVQGSLTGWPWPATWAVYFLLLCAFLVIGSRVQRLFYDSPPGGAAAST